jgi:hypothetical protein
MKSSTQPDVSQANPLMMAAIPEEQVIETVSSGPLKLNSLASSDVRFPGVVTGETNGEMGLPLEKAS